MCRQWLERGSRPLSSQEECGLPKEGTSLQIFHKDTGKAWGILDDLYDDSRKNAAVLLRIIRLGGNGGIASRKGEVERRDKKILRREICMHDVHCHHAGPR